MSRHARTAQRLALLGPSTPAPKAPLDPAHALLDRIAAGELDVHLTAIAEAVRARSDLLHAVNSAKALARLQVGDRVRINHRVSPRYLHGILGTIVDIDDRNATICLHRRVGRFESEIRCPPLALDLLPPHPDGRRTQGAAPS